MSCFLLGKGVKKLLRLEEAGASSPSSTQGLSSPKSNRGLLMILGRVSGLSSYGNRSDHYSSGSPARHGAALGQHLSLISPPLPTPQVATDCPTARGNCPMVSKAHPDQ